MDAPRAVQHDVPLGRGDRPAALHEPCVHGAGGNPCGTVHPSNGGAPTNASFAAANYQGAGLARFAASIHQLGAHAADPELKEVKA